MGGFLSHLKPENNESVFEATCGPIRGNVYEHNEKIVDGYLGIPYAKPPIGDLRFKKPVAAEKWTEPLDCYEYGPACPQSGSYSVLCPDFVKIDEEKCLTLNVFSPRWKSNEYPNGRPVFVYIHGGGFEVGYSAYLNDYSLSGTIPLRDIVVVTINYRVGPLGFLTTGDDVAKGNYGLWDQTLALKWIQEHISCFGGDPDNVTISGGSAGAISVDMLALSPHSNNTKSLLEWYKAQDVSIFKKTNEVEKDFSGFIFFVPNFDGDFFPKPIEELRKEAPKLDSIVSIGEYEGLGMIGGNPLCTSKNPLENLRVTIADAYSSDVTKNHEDVQKKIFEFYAKDIDITDENDVVKKLVEFIGDYMFTYCSLETAKSCTINGSNVYLASFDYCNNETEEEIVSRSFPFKAATHGSDHQYLFGDGITMKFNPTEEQFKVMEMMGGFVENFVKYGNPNGKNSNGKWEKYSLKRPDRYFKIDYPNSEMKNDFQNGRLKIFEEVKNNDNRYENIGKAI
uniref:Carboxylic ester hydrolase n=1 Tax=Caenorhabditis tropicalis TaxID=1561998 RepID=A0A1I7TYW1_9PELO